MSKRKDFVLGNPPAGIYKGDLHIGYAFYHVILDIYARYLSTHEKFNVVSPRFSLNVFGKRADRLSEKQDPEDFRKEVNTWVEKWISQNRLRDKLNLSLDGLLIDNSKESVEEAQKTFLNLNQRGYLLRIGQTDFLDVEKISKERDLVSVVNGISFYPLRTKTEFLRMLKENTKKPVALTKSTKYSAPNPLGGENLGPLFVISTIWETYHPKGVDLLATSDKELARYTLLRFLVRMATHSDPLTKGILTYNKIEPEDGLESWNVQKLTKNEYETDMLRYAFVKSHSVAAQKVRLEKSSLKGGRNFVYLVGNLRKFFMGQDVHCSTKNDTPFIESDYRKNMRDFRFNDVLSELEIGLKSLSRDINLSRNNGCLEANLPQFINQYSFYLDKVEPFCPAIVESVRKSLVANY